MGSFCDARPMLDRIFLHTELMDRMMQRVGVDPLAAARAEHGAGWYEARTRCVACHAERSCRSWLEHECACAIVPEFCPNAAFFRSCLSQILRNRGIVPTD